MQVSLLRLTEKKNLWIQKSVEISRFLHITILEPETGYFTSIRFKIPTAHAFFYL